MKAWYDIESGGFKKGEMVVIASTPSGKSSYYEAMMGSKVKFQTVYQAEVDGEMWYTIRTSNREVSKWIRSQENTMMVETTVNYPDYFDVHEKIYIMLELKYK